MQIVFGARFGDVDSFSIAFVNINFYAAIKNVFPKAKLHFLQLPNKNS